VHNVPAVSAQLENVVETNYMMVYARSFHLDLVQRERYQSNQFAVIVYYVWVDPVNAFVIALAKDVIYAHIDLENVF
jgi:hypothetical protein